jgi:Malectin domain
LSVIQGFTRAYYFNNTIAGVPPEFDPLSFQDHRSADPDVETEQSFNYSLAGFESMEEAIITLGFAENYFPNCEVGKRIFTITVNGEPFAENLDVFNATGCYSALVLTKTVRATTDGEFLIQFSPAGEGSNPMVAILQVKPLDLLSNKPSDRPFFVPPPVAPPTMPPLLVSPATPPPILVVQPSPSTTSPPSQINATFQVVRASRCH